MRRHLRRLLVTALFPSFPLFLGAGLVSASAAADPVAASRVLPVARAQAVSATSAIVRRAGDPVMVEWGGSMWRGTVLVAHPDGSALIHYVGWGKEWDEVAPPARLRSELRDAKAPRGDETVLVEWGGSYWTATVVRVTQDGFLIHYVGWGPEWDEVVTRTRITRMAP